MIVALPDDVMRSVCGHLQCRDRASVRVVCLRFERIVPSRHSVRLLDGRPLFELVLLSPYISLLSGQLPLLTTSVVSSLFLALCIACNDDTCLGFAFFMLPMHYVFFAHTGCNLLVGAICRLESRYFSWLAISFFGILTLVVAWWLSRVVSKARRMRSLIRSRDVRRGISPTRSQSVWTCLVSVSAPLGCRRNRGKHVALDDASASLV